jgi:uncharacterized ferritin-like protein (DUF455 family)
MIAPPDPNTQVLVEQQVERKHQQLPLTLQRLLKGEALEVPFEPGRDVQILPIKQLPAKPGLSKALGQARLLHDLASIELQAMELGVRTLAEFPEAPEGFRRDLAEVSFEEGEHLALCLKNIEELGFKWGSFPTHIGLWQAVRVEDSLLDRILIVHRYLEGSGLDASDTILRRLAGIHGASALKTVERIRRDEMKHVLFGSDWFKKIVRQEGADPDEDFRLRLMRLIGRIPRRLEPISHSVRSEAGFTETEIQVLEEVRQIWLKPGLDPIHQTPIGH